jgi:hypothetical protein
MLNRPEYWRASDERLGTLQKIYEFVQFLCFLWFFVGLFLVLHPQGEEEEVTEWEENAFSSFWGGQLVRRILEVLFFRMVFLFETLLVLFVLNNLITIIKPPAVTWRCW